MSIPPDRQSESKHIGGYHDQMPRWIAQSPTFRSKLYGGVEAKLMQWLISRQDWHTRLVPLVGPSELAEKIGINRNRVARALENLLAFEAIKYRRQGRRYRIELCFYPPRAGRTATTPSPDTQNNVHEGFADHERELNAGMNNDSPLSAEVQKLSAPSELSNERWRIGQPEVAESATFPGEATSAPFEENPSTYEPGCDPEAFGQTFS